MDDRFAEDLEAALQTRPVIEQAKGVLIGLYRLTPDQAFAALVRVSQNHNVKVRSLAAALVHTAGGQPVEDRAATRALMSEWGGLLNGFSVVRDTASRESA